MESGAEQGTLALDSRMVALPFGELAQLRAEARDQRARAEAAEQRLAALRGETPVFRLITHLAHRAECSTRHNRAGWREAITEARFFALGLEEDEAAK